MTILTETANQLPQITDDIRKLTIGWIWLGVYSLLAAGILALLLAFSRTPAIQDLMPGSNFFRIALVVHVDLSALVWLLACAGILWSATTHRRYNQLAFWLAVAGTLMLSVAPFVGADKPLMNNYVPVLQHPWFFCSLVVLAAGLVLQAGGYIVNNPPKFRDADGLSALRLALFLGALAALLAVACIGYAYFTLPSSLAGEYYYDLLFWGGGHVLQFVHTLLMLVVWVMLLAACKHPAPSSPGKTMALFALVVAPLLALPWIYQHPVDSNAHILSWTQLMRIGGLGCVPLGLLVLMRLFRHARLSPQLRPLRASLLSSVTLFGAGGIMGLMIMGSNTVIPAHYHGSIVGVTLAFMGLIYYLLPQLGFRIRYLNLAYWQPFLYGGGQLVHITALAWSGGYGVKRKTAGAAQGLDSFQEILGMALMGLGGLAAAIGGVIFLVVVIAALRTEPHFDRGPSPEPVLAQTGGA